jgi:hypothetical protein
MSGQPPVGAAQRARHGQDWRRCGRLGVFRGPREVAMPPIPRHGTFARRGAPR